MFTAVGDQVPVMPLVEVVGKVGAGYPKHRGPTGLKVGTVGFVIVTAIVLTVAQTPGLGVNV